ncbi:MAG: CBS domain-containing protein [Deltaproteobacteria bacterium]|nr:CBS domain-containing protein [Deltaproteobacteria bacterium]MBT4092136.1 CBS domain-containing protein [Deltaproteobacteria bacterium]MBT4269382.1 CBS domain-containing protein [Deltaproteobacteria bacterium]MBT4638681.1 CBS domain-containing protein [Deltaproteobacteria bacterium]MBT6501892.1 CBS domain-containing protein [Deltaproteobacteria bacterium]
MIVKNWMSKDVITADINHSLHTAMRLINKHGIGSLPVMKKGKMVGMVSAEDIRRALITTHSSGEVQTTGAIDGTKVSEIMRENMFLVSLFSILDEVAEMLLRNNISSAPVMDENGDIAGIITKTDICKALISLSGKTNREFDFGFQVEDSPGSIKVITDIIRSLGGRIASILISYDEVPEGFRNVFIRVYNIERENLDKLKSKLIPAATMLYMFDYEKPSRQIF